ncbi:MAG: hypothetical protein RJA02_2308 [Armatimonadota bacterium]
MSASFLHPALGVDNHHWSVDSTEVVSVGTLRAGFAQMLLQYYRIAKQRPISPYPKRSIVLNLTGIVKHINGQGQEVFWRERVRIELTQAG